MESLKVEQLTLKPTETPNEAFGQEPEETIEERTLYPKIKKLRDFIIEFRKHETRHQLPPAKSIHLTGTVKLHGTHADIVFKSDSDEIRLQSRNQLTLNIDKDNCGFAAYVAGLQATTLLNLRDGILDRYRKLNPGIEVEGEVVVAGEWCGIGVQRKVAIANVARFFAIISININNSWLPDWDYSDICDENVRIFNIGKAGFFQHELSFDNIEASEKTIQELTDAVEAECPFGKLLGEKGKGEGIVWKATNLCGKPIYWFKSKGESLAVSHSNKLPANAVAPENRDRMENFAKAIVTEARLEQGWENLECKDKAGIRDFLRWVADDCFVEERREMDEMNISKWKLSPAITAIAKPWFWARKEIE